MKIRYYSMFIVFLLTTDLYSQCPGDPATESDGTINITGTCLPTEYQIGCHCYDKLIIDWLYGFNNKLFHWPPGIELPKGGGGKGSNDNSKKPTDENCASAYTSCLIDAGERYSRCMAEKMLKTSLTRIYQNKSCYPEGDLKLMKSIVIVGYQCDADDFYDDKWESKMCRLNWRRAAAKECIFGNPSETDSKQETISFSLDLAGFGELGIGGNTVISFSYPSNEGIREVCGDLNDLIESACDTAKSNCLQSANSSSRLLAKANENIIIVQRNDIRTDEIIEKIDQRLLGLQPRIPNFRPNQAAVPVEANFRKVSRGTVEGYSHYINRLRFLKSWSDFLIKNHVSSMKQKQLQNEFSNFQYSFNAIYTDFVDILIYDTFKDSTDQQKNLVNSKNLKDFLDNNTFSSRIKRAETSLLNNVENILGTNLSKKFKNGVWIGGFEFGMCQPMINKQVAIRPNP